MFVKASRARHQQIVASPPGSAYKPHMPRIRRMLLSLLAVIGLVSTLGWDATAMACPLDTVVTAHSDGCDHSPAPAKPQLPGHPVQLCAACIAILPLPMQIAANAPPPVAPAISRLRPLSGVDPGLDPPPPRAA